MSGPASTPPESPAGAQGARLGGAPAAAPHALGSPTKNPLTELTSGGWKRGLLRLAVGMALVAGVLHFVGEDSWRLLDDPALFGAVAAGAVVHLAQRLMRVEKWRRMLTPTSVAQRSLPFLLRIQLIGMVANLMLPVSEAVKVWAVSRTRADVRVATTSIVVDMAMHTALVGLLGAGAALLLAWWDITVWAAALTMGVAPLGVMVAARHVLARSPSGRLVDARPDVWALAAGETACQIGLYVIAFTSMGASAEPLRIVALAPVLYIVDLLNVTPSGLGLREGLFAVVLGALPDASAELGVATGLLVSSMLLTATLVGGGLALLLPNRAPPTVDDAPSGSGPDGAPPHDDAPPAR